jgi:hypothetical protein
VCTHIRNRLTGHRDVFGFQGHVTGSVSDETKVPQSQEAM